MIQNFDRHFEKHHNYETEYLKVLYYDLSKDYKEMYRSYQYNRLCTIVSGTKHVKINNGEEFDYNQSEFILLPPDSSVELEIKEDTIAIVYEMSDKLIEDTKSRIQLQFQDDFMMPKNTIIKESFSEKIKAPIERINNYCMGNDPNKTFLVDLCSQELIYNLMKDYYISLNPSSNHLDPVNYTIKFLKENIYQNITIKEIAEHLNMSTSNLIACFKKRMNMTPKEYQNLLKLKTSKEALKYKNVTEVCYDLGFENVSYFIKLFKNYYGETPKQFAMRINEF
ncbi:AraC family transcriptional regulator [Cellulosilyticum sp. I15G10I2]|uniref:AraC family transcriptional regulator n=1 Tax=Cellulosilyticum sp. I15G10I2 TaxID=1892843 RepID=UPI00085C3135|nr:AraC family transcriptional regulator [Cellulosilyticum sp. I15G10I2]